MIRFSEFIGLRFSATNAFVFASQAPTQWAGAIACGAGRGPRSRGVETGFLPGCRGEHQQIHDLRHAGAAHLAQTGQFCIV